MATSETLVDRELAEESTGCPECGGDVVATEGESTCEDCGLVVDEHRIDHGRASRFGESHHGPPSTAQRHDRGLGTASLGYADIHGKPVNSARLSRMRTQEARAHFSSKRERTLGHAIDEIRRMTSATGQGKTITEQASALARTAQEADMFPGRSIEGMAAASVLAALRVNGRPFASRDLAPFANCDEAEIKSAYRYLNRELDLPAPPPTVASQVPKIASAVDFPDGYEAEALEMARELDESGALSGRRPSIVGAACIYLVARGYGANWTGFDQRTLAAAADCTPEGLRDAYRAIEEVDDER